MSDDAHTRRNCLQWGLRILSPKAYYSLLKRYTINLSPNAYKNIKKEHISETTEFWWYSWLTCEILDKGILVNIATGRKIADWRRDYEVIATFRTWSAYEDFREELRGVTAKQIMG